MKNEDTYDAIAWASQVAASDAKVFVHWLRGSLDGVVPQETSDASEASC